MLQMFHPRKPYHHRVRAAGPTAAQGATVLTVRRDYDGRYTWTFDGTFDDAGSGGWTPVDLAGLVVEDRPVGIDEVKGGQGTISLFYATASGATYDVTSAPAVLRFDGGRALLVPQSGDVIQPPPPVISPTVDAVGEGGRFTWYFAESFDDAAAPTWHASDFAELTIDGTVPSGIDEVIGADGSLTLVYPFDSAPSWHAIGKPAVLHFANGAEGFSPDSGPVNS